MGVVPFMLAYGAETMLPMEIEVLAARLATTAQVDPFTNNDHTTKCITALERLEEYRSDTSKHFELYREKMAPNYSKHTSSYSFTPRILVLCNAREV